MNKPTFHIEDARILTNDTTGTRVLIGRSLDDRPANGIKVGSRIITSPIVSIDGDEVETKNTKYIVGSWAEVG